MKYMYMICACFYNKVLYMYCKISELVIYSVFNIVVFSF